jgi:FKBP-type peptidyl-prolyl cis-trans isomerase
MKIKSLFLLLSGTIVNALVLTAQQPSSKAVTQNPVSVKLITSTDTIQYSLGAYIGQWFVKSGFVINNKVLFQRGMDDVLQNKKLALADSLINPIVSSYQISLQNAKSRALEDQLFAALKGKPGVGALPDGVHYIVLKTGTGLRPSLKDTVTLNAIGVFPDGTVFEDTYQKKKSIKTVAASLIPGLNEAIQLMPEGSTWRIFVPSALGYGPAGLPNVIPPNMALIFDVNLLEVKVNK